MINRIEMHNITQVYGNAVALKDVSLTIRPGEMTFIRGNNGAGKSTLMAIISTILKPTRGRLIYAPYGESRKIARQHIGWIAHDSHCYAELTGKENVELAAQYYGYKVKDAWKRVCNRVQARRFENQAVATLSRGQRQRIALARALCHEPSVLLLDEPMTGLDQASAEQIQRVLIEERERGRIIIVISHDVSKREGRHIFMKDGRVEKIEEI